MIIEMMRLHRGSKRRDASCKRGGRFWFQLLTSRTHHPLAIWFETIPSTRLDHKRRLFGKTRVRCKRSIMDSVKGSCLNATPSPFKTITAVSHRQLTIQELHAVGRGSSTSVPSRLEAPAPTRTEQSKANVAWWTKEPLSGFIGLAAALLIAGHIPTIPAGFDSTVILKEIDEEGRLVLGSSLVRIPNK